VDEEEWPNSDALFDFPGGQQDASVRWQHALDEGLQSGTLKLLHIAGATYTLRGDCPRCGHEMAQVLEFRVVLPVSAGSTGGAAESATFDIVCSCRATTHEGRDPTQWGCGWGRGLPVVIAEPGDT
jgi:hypothetical protein